MTTATDAAPAAPKGEKLMLLQYLRGVAALMVVFHHARNPAAWLFDPLADFNVGRHGVSIFFVLSGFIMFFAARNEPPLEFARRRIIRVVPMYWIATFSLAFLGLIGWGVLPDSIGQLLKSLFFIPHYSPQKPEFVYPYLVPGWTLNYEMFFYAVFMVGILSGRIMLTVATIILGLFFTGLFIDTTPAAIHIYTSYRMLEFLAGILIAKAYMTVPLRHLEWLLVPAVPLLLLSDTIDMTEMLTVSLPSAGIVLGTLALQRRVRGTHAWLKALGDASYSLYLFHPLVLMVVNRFIRHVPLTGWPQFIFVMIFDIACSIVAAILIYRLVEKPLIAMLNKSGRSGNLRTKTA